MLPKLFCPFVVSQDFLKLLGIFELHRDTFGPFFGPIQKEFDGALTEFFAVSIQFLQWGEGPRVLRWKSRRVEESKSGRVCSGWILVGGCVGDLVV